MIIVAFAFAAAFFCLLHAALRVLTNGFTALAVVVSIHVFVLVTCISFILLLLLLIIIIILCF